MKKLIPCIFLLFATVGTVRSQELQRIIPESPEANAFSKYDKIPVNYHSGLPTVEIPLYTISTRSGLQLPIKLTYHASGIKVNEHATPVGLGWSLNTGGMISREVYGLPDELYPRQYPINVGEDLHTSLSGFDLFESGDPPPGCFISEEQLNDYTYAIDVMGLSNPGGGGNPKSIDALPDIFYYATPTISGKFILDTQGEAQTIPHEPIKIKTAGGPLDGFNIIDAQGNHFEYHTTATYMEIPQLDPYASFAEQSKLTKITTPLNEVIDFTYAIESYTYTNPTPLTDYTPYANSQACNTPPHNPTPTQTQFHAKRLEEINFEGGRIVFHYSDDASYAIAGATDRRDLPGASALRRVVVYNTHDVVIKEYTLDYSYFSSDPTALADPDAHRLKLDSVTELGQPSYTFAYFGDGYIPHRMSDQQDYWGYYGGDGGLLPQLHFGDMELSGSDRSVDHTLIKTGALRSITYPTKGTTTFYFNENNYLSLQEEFQYITTSTPVFNSKGTHVFTLPEDANNTRKVHIQNDCGNTGTELENILEGYCFFQLLDDQNNVIFQTTDSGTYTVENLSETPGVNYKFVIDQLDVQNCNCSIAMEGETEQNTPVLKPSQLPGLRLDSMVMDPLVGEPVSTTFDYNDLETGQISRPTLLPRFHFLKKSVSIGAGNDSNCTFIQRNSAPVKTYTSSGYQYVTVNKTGIGSTRYTFNTSSSSREMTPLIHLSFGSFLAGLPAKTAYFRQDGTLLKSEENTYTVAHSLNAESNDYMSQQPGSIALGLSFNPYGTAHTGCNPAYSYHLMDYNIYNIPGGWVKKQSTTTVDYVYDENDNLIDEAIQTISYNYENELHQQPTKTTVVTSTGDTLITKTYYPFDINTPDALNEGPPFSVSEFSAINTLKEPHVHRLAVPVQVSNYKIDDLGNEQVLSIQRNIYKDWGAGLALPEKVQIAIDGQTPEDRIAYKEYDTFGNPLEVSKTGGEAISYIWGYQNTKPIAKLEGVPYSELDPVVIADLQNLSDNDTDALSEQTLRNALNALRDSHSDAVITTFTYDPLIGVTSSTDPGGQTHFYTYDDFNRLAATKDAHSDIIASYNYNYAQETPPVYAPLNVAVDYGSHSNDHQWFIANPDGGSGGFSYAWFEGIGNSSIAFEATPSGTNDTYQFMVSCGQLRYVKLVVTDTTTGEIVEAVKANNNSCDYPPLNATITYGPHNNDFQWFLSNVSGGSGNYSYAWYEGMGSSNVDFETIALGTASSYQLFIPCTTYKYVKLVVTDTITGLTVSKVKVSNNNPCTGNENEQQ